MRKLLLFSLMVGASGAAVAAPATKPAPAAVASKASLEKVNAGELRLEGNISALLGDGVWQLDAVSWTSPRGVTTNFDDVKTKAVQLSPDAIIHLPGAATKVALKDVKLKTTVAVIGKNGPDGELIVREVIVLGNNDRDHRTVGTLTANRETVSLIEQSRKARDLGQLPKSLEYAKRAADTAAAMGDASGEALASQDLGIVYSELRQYKEAMSAYRREQALGERIGNALAQVLGIDGQAGLLAASKQTDAAISLLERAVALSPSVPQSLQRDVLGQLASVYQQAGKRNEAVGALVRLLPMEEGDDALGTLLSLAVLQAPVDKDSAQDYLNQARPRVDNIRDEQNRINLLTLFGDALRATGDTTNAVVQYQNAAKLLDDKGETEKAAKLREKASRAANGTDEPTADNTTPDAGGGDAPEPPPL